MLKTVRTLLAACVGLAVFGWAVAASAAPITRTYDFFAAGFAAGPLTSVDGTLIVTFDPMTLANTTGSPVEVGSFVDLGVLGIVGPAQLIFDYLNSGGEDLLTVGGIPLGVDGIDLNAVDFLIQIGNASGDPNASTVAYSDGNGNEFATELTSIAAVGVDVPEPGTLALLVPALLALGFFAWQQRRQVGRASATA